MRRVTLAFFCLIGLLFNAQTFAKDLAGAADHPAISRYPASQIKWYDVQAFEPYAIAVGPVTGYRKIDDWLETQGRTTRIYYELEGAKTHTEVYANYLQALEEQGFKILANNVFSKSSRANDVGSRKWLDIHFARNAVPPDGLRLLKGSSTSGGTGFMQPRRNALQARYMSPSLLLNIVRTSSPR